MTKMRCRAALPAVLIALALGACGGNDGGEITDGARASLTPLVANVRNSAESFDPDGAAHALTTVRQEVERLRASGDIGEGRAQEILAAAVQVERRLELAPTTTTTTTTTVTTRPPVVTEPPKDDSKGKGNGNGNGNGKD
jgi:hypothetical protein